MQPMIHTFSFAGTINFEQFYVINSIITTDFMIPIKNTFIFIIRVIAILT